jgi:uncharacterized OsmC-like protein
MTLISCTYLGDGQTTLQHSDSQVEIRTDLPVDNGGQGRDFSPTDLFASSLGACAATIMGKMAESQGKSITGTHIAIEKEMGANPRHVAKIILRFAFPESVDAKDRAKYLASIKACPVHNSLGDNVVVEVHSN